MGLPNDNNGKPIPSQLGVTGAFIPKGAKNLEVGKDFLSLSWRPRHLDKPAARDAPTGAPGAYAQPAPLALSGPLWFY
jgi:hypothetical protein